MDSYRTSLPTGQYSISQSDVADFLIEQYLFAVREAGPYGEQGNEQIADGLEHLRSVIWPRSFGLRTYGTISDTDRQEVFEATLNGLAGATPEETLRLQRALLDGFGKMGHLYEMAGLVARENFFDFVRREEGVVSRSPEDYVRQFQDFFVSREEMIRQLNTPGFEMVMTAHPTNVNSLPLVASLRHLGEAIEQARTHGEGAEALRQPLAAIARTPMIPVDDLGELAPLTVRDETLFILNYLNNMYQDLRQVYRDFDEALAPVNEKEPYDPLKLRLDVRAASWGSSGDKDGNDNVTAETTMEAIAMHRLAVTAHYLIDLEAIPALGSWKTNLESTHRNLQSFIEELRDAKDAKGFLEPGAFDAFADRLAALTPDAKAFERDLETAYREQPSEPTLDLLRHVRAFGMGFGKIEYRETAERFTQIMEALIPGYEGFDSGMRQALLEVLITRPETIEPEKRAEIQRRFDRLLTEGPQRPYSKSDAAPIAYHTLRRMQLAGQHPDMIENHVLAECQTTAHMLEAVYLQKLAGKNAPTLGIIPLFEDAERMDQVGEIMNGAYDSAAYRTHLDQVKAHRGTDKRVQQVQFAHSDNARRSGMPAARAYIFDGHLLHLEAGKTHGVETQCFEGGSQLDAYRGGIRAATGAINNYQLFEGEYPLYKATYQGADLHGYFKTPGSAVRHIERVMGHMASNSNGFLGGERNRRILEATEGETRINDGRTNADRIALDALKATRQDYQGGIFGQPVLDIVLSLLNDNGAGNIGSRKVSREDKDKPKEPVVFAAGSKVELGAALKAESVRTITFSEIFQHSGITPTWLGAGKLRERTLDAYNDRMRALGEQPVKTLNPSDLKALFEESDVFHDAIDRMAYGLACSNFPYFQSICGKLLAEAQKQGRYQSNAGEVTKFIGDLGQEYREATAFVYEAMNGKSYEAHLQKQGKTLNDAGFDELRDDMIAQLPELGQIIQDKNAYVSFIQHLKLSPALMSDKTLRTYIHGALDLQLSRMPTDDPSYRKQAEPYLENSRRFASLVRTGRAAEARRVISP